MKKVFRLLGLSTLVLGLAVACGNSQPTDENNGDTTKDNLVEEEQPIEDVTIDSALAADEETPAPATDNKKKTTTTKKADKGVSTTDQTKVPTNAVATKKVEEQPVKAVEANTTVVKEDNLDKKATKAKAKLKR